MVRLRFIFYLLGFLLVCIFSAQAQKKRPNVVYVFADQWRAQATGYSGNPNVNTPHLDKLAARSIDFVNAVSCEASCTPYRASLMTGQYPTTHGLILNDLLLDPEAVTLGKIFKAAGYHTAYVGKWHMDGHYRRAFTPKNHRQGFEYWKVMNCTHDYMNSYYYGDTPKKMKWEGYDAHAQAKDVCEYIKQHADDKQPFCLFLSWGPPHNPYREVPRRYLDMFDTSKIKLRPNVPKADREKALRDIQGYYAHITALDEAVGWILNTIKETGIEDNTIFIFTADHGDMLGSHGEYGKSVPYDEAIRVPFLLHFPVVSASKGRKIEMPINTPDIMPTLLGLCNISIPYGVEGNDFSKIVTGKDSEKDDYAALIESPTKNVAGREFRGIRTIRYTYVEDLKGAWFLFDNKKDPYQMHNLANRSSYKLVQDEMKNKLRNALRLANDEFLPGYKYLNKFGIYITSGGYPPFELHYPFSPDTYSNKKDKNE